MTRLPDHHAALTAANFSLSDQHLFLFGLLRTELWTWESPRSASVRS